MTGAGACVLSKKKPNFEDNLVKSNQVIEDMNEKDRKFILDTAVARVKYEKNHVAKVVEGTIGRVVDLGIDDESNMGAAMAPAAADTIIRHLGDFDRKIDYYDAIFTGDLGRYGKELLEYILSKEGIDLSDTYMDTGASYFKPEQQTFQGGSGAGCISTVFNGYILSKLENGALNRILVVPTGALLNKDTPLQKETIPGIAHAFVVESEKIKEKYSKKQ